MAEKTEISAGRTGGVAPLVAPSLRAPHGFFTRLGGVSSGVYASLQCGWGAKTDPAENVAENRARAARALGAAPERLATLYQVHSARIVTLDAPLDPGARPEADGLVTASPGLVIGALAADCAPVLLEDAEAGVVGACHAGWRGAFDGVIQATVAAMRAIGARADRMRAAIGPCIGPNAYEVGPEYVARFIADDPANDRFFRTPPDAARAAAGYAHFDLPGYALSRLAGAGVTEARWIGRCTYSEPDLFFSNRRALHRGEADYGRLLSAIAPPPSP